MDAPDDDRPIAAPPEAMLIRKARKARGLTIAEAAGLTGIVKASRWGQIENGYIMKDGVPMPTSAQDMQLAHMARSVGVTPRQLAEAGRQDGAEVLLEMERQVTAGQAGSDDDMSAGELTAVRQMDALLAAMQEAGKRAAREEVAADLEEMRQRITRMEEQLRKETS